MLNQWTILSHLKQMASIEEEGTAFGLSLCVASLEEVWARLRDGSDENDARIGRAAAGLAFYKLALKRMAQDPATVFKAGDVSVTQNPAQLLVIAAKVRDEALAAAAPLLKDELFLFKQI